MAKIIMMGVWKVRKKCPNSGKSNHKTRVSLVVDTVRGVVIAMQQIYI